MISLSRASAATSEEHTMPTTTIGTRLSIRKITARIGAEVTGLDPALELDAETVTAIRQALNEHKALVFRGISLDDEGQQRFARYFGELTTAHPTVPAVPGAPHVLPVDSMDGPVNHWHTDVTFVLTPPQVSTLRSIVVPPYGGETLIASTGAAYRDLPGPLRDFADTLWAVHTNDHDYAVPPESLTDAERQRREIFVSTRYETVHPVVRVHPLTGERGLFIGGFAQRIAGLSTGESRDILRLLQSYVTRPENVLRVAWQPGQLVMFDNRITQHYAPDNYDRQPRRLNRVTVAGDVPAGIDGRPSHSLAGDASHYTAAPLAVPR
jgi:taurine dioxygenase